MECKIPVYLSKPSLAGVSAAGDLHFNLCPVLKGKTDIFFIKNCDKVNQAVHRVPCETAHRLGDDEVDAPSRASATILLKPSRFVVEVALIPSSI